MSRSKSKQTPPPARPAPKKQARGPPKPAAKRRPRVTRGARPPSGVAMLHPRLTAAHLTTPSLAATPYVVVRDKITSTIAPSTTGGMTVILVGAFNAGNNDKMSTTYGVYGSGASLPGGSNDFRFAGVNYAGGGNINRMRVHRLAVRVVNTGGSSAITVPDGKFWMGTLRGHVERGHFADYNALGAFLRGRNELREYSNYSAFTSAKTAVCAPYDFLDWEAFKDTIDVTAPNAKPADVLSQVAIVLGPTSNAQNFDVQIDVELCVQFTVDPLLQSLAKHHPAAPESVWHAARRFVSEHTPVLEDAGIAAGAAAFGPEMLGGAAAYFGGRGVLGAAARFGGRPMRALGV